MTAPKSHTPPPISLSESEIEDSDLDLTSSSLEEQAKRVLKPSMIRSLKKIAYYTAKVGLPLDEACLLIDMDYQAFQDEMKMEPLIGKIIRIKELEYKKDLLYTLSQRARSGDDKLAAWLLERRYPLEYGDQKRPSSSEDNQDVIFEAIQWIRKRGSNSPLVSLGSGHPITLKRDQDTGKVITERIEAIMGTNPPRFSPNANEIITKHPHARE